MRLISCEMGFGDGKMRQGACKWAFGGIPRSSGGCLFRVGAGKTGGDGVRAAFVMCGEVFLRISQSRLPFKSR